MPKLYEMEKGSKIYSDVGDGSSYVVFDHVDGMYSYCVTEKGNVVHIYFAEDFDPYEDGYKLKTK